MTVPKVDESKCTGCESCVETCPAEAITITDNSKAKINPDLCAECGACVDTCPVEAISQDD
jgi:ferredoxin